MTVQVALICEAATTAYGTCPTVRYTSAQTADEAREQAAQHGWSRTPAGRDICPAHTSGQWKVLVPDP